jgi:hypothetical protein
MTPKIKDRGPQKKFFLRRILQDVVADRVKPLTASDPIVVILRAAEAIAVGLGFAALGWERKKRGRVLGSHFGGRN